jgi:hypothetical protein
MKVQQPKLDVDPQLRSIDYSIDALIPGLYLWFGLVRLRLGGSLSEANYSGTIYDPVGIALVIPGYRLYSTYRGSYDVG